MPNRPLLRSRLVSARAKRTLLASSSAFLRSSTVRSGALLNINGLVYIAASDPANPPHTALARRFLPLLDKAQNPNGVAFVPGCGTGTSHPTPPSGDAFPGVSLAGVEVGGVVRASASIEAVGASAAA